MNIRVTVKTLLSITLVATTLFAMSGCNNSTSDANMVSAESNISLNQNNNGNTSIPNDSSGNVNSVASTDGQSGNTDNGSNGNASDENISSVVETQTEPTTAQQSNMERHNPYAGSDGFYMFYIKDDGTEFTPIPPTWVEITTDDGTEITLNVSGKELTFDGQPPIIKDGEIFVPINGVFEHLTGPNGIALQPPFTAKWDESTTTATIANHWYTAIFRQGENHFTLNTRLHQVGDAMSSEAITPDIPAHMVNGMFMLPLRAVAESMLMIFEWDEMSKTAYVYNVTVIVANAPR